MICKLFSWLASEFFNCKAMSDGAQELMNQMIKEIE